MIQLIFESFSLFRQNWKPLEESLVPTMGVYNICHHEMTQKRLKVQTVYIHELYIKRDPYFDIALLKLKEEAKGFEPVCLPIKGMIRD